jgi:hypothetical protein
MMRTVVMIFPRIAMMRLFRHTLLFVLFVLACLPTKGSQILIPMDAESQANHLKAYGISYWVLEQNVNIYWLLNYRGGSFLIPHSAEIERECIIRGVSYAVLDEGSAGAILAEIASPSKNMEAVKLEVALKLPFIRQKVPSPGTMP